MSDSSQSGAAMIGKWPNPISFLEDYGCFAVNVRPAVIRGIAEEFYRTRNTNEKHLLFLAGFEQTFFGIETLLAFFNAATDEAPLDLAKWIYPRKVNGKKYYEFSNMQTRVDKMIRGDILKVYQNEFPELNSVEMKALVDPLEQILSYLQTTARKRQLLTRDITETLITIFNRSKHKFLVYRHKGDIAFLLSAETESDLHEVAQKVPRGGVKQKKAIPDMSWLVDHSCTLRDYIRIAIDRIVIRLSKSGANKWLSGPAKNRGTIILLH